MKFTLDNFIEQPDGSALANVEYDDKFLDFVEEWWKETFNILKATEQEKVQAFIIKVLRDHIKENDDK